MKPLRDIYLIHYQRYPSMQWLDFMKLIYQNAFGPSHFNNQPNIEAIETYLLKELQNAKYFTSTPLVEDLGNSYARVYLKTIHKELISIKELAEIFYNSMTLKPIITNEMKTMFETQCTVLVSMIDNQDLLYNKEEALSFIEQYDDLQYPAFRHSAIYNELYTPHYRVIHHSFLPQNLLEIMERVF